MRTIGCIAICIVQGLDDPMTTNDRANIWLCFIFNSADAVFEMMSSKFVLKKKRSLIQIHQSNNHVSQPAKANICNGKENLNIKTA